MAAAVALLALAVVVLAVQLARSERELRSIARFLVDRDTLSNTRVTVSVHTRGFVRLGQAINRQIDRHQGERIAAEENKRDLRRGLTYLSHDIRTPLSGAQGYAQLLADEQDETERARYLDVVERRLDDVSGLLDQLYAYAQVQDPDYRIERERVDVSQVLMESLASLYAPFKERGWTPDIQLADAPLIALSDGDSLGRIFRNLVVNALRYGSEAPRIVQGGTAITFSNRVANPEAIDAERLFERFYQGDAARAGDGSGLGLAIVAQLAKALDIKLAARLEVDVLSISLEFAG
ncbi:HAMP domain-containing histidine kinase [Eggerthella guodeyinii]|uniref:Sensor-like histidine kinase SenX3 n=1 Tax=Eggerthella guodeyinii TaxID=2690837 RepID=A0A6L7IMS0_9ACTN|nr:HAMP domain-containing sensor histidine kinase [Eggerthella guodeyinii]QOS68200.1 HAMP domain-containing histidine kinase [Eggerthella guodeyinii]